MHLNELEIENRQKLRSFHRVVKANPKEYRIKIVRDDLLQSVTFHLYLENLCIDSVITFLK